MTHQIREMFPADPLSDNMRRARRAQRMAVTGLLFGGIALGMALAVITHRAVERIAYEHAYPTTPATIIHVMERAQ